MSDPHIQPTVVGSLDMVSEVDRGVLRRAVGDGPSNGKRRWGGITDEKKRQYIQALDVALRLSLEKSDQRGVNGCVKTLAMLEGQNQGDEHLEIRIKSEAKNTDRDIIRTAQVALSPEQSDALAKVVDELSGKLGDA